MASHDLKRGFNRFFVVLTVVWVLWCAYLPFRERGNFLEMTAETHVQQKLQCQTKDCRQDVEDDEARVWRENPIRKWYADEFWEVLLGAVGVPPIFYGAVRGISAVALWIWHGFQR